MFADALAAAIEGSHPRQFDQLSRQLWQAHAAGHIDDAAAQRLADTMHTTRLPRRALPHPGFAPRGFMRAREQRSPDRTASILRRRRLAASGPMPPTLAAGFTTGQMAVLRIAADEVAAHGFCDRSLAELAARAGVCRKLAQMTIRPAAGLIAVQRRPRPGRKNLTNIVKIVSPEWVTWIRHRNHRQGEKIRTPRSKDLERSSLSCLTPAGAFVHSIVRRTADAEVYQAKPMAYLRYRRRADPHHILSPLFAALR
jgi:hypothetical protein